MSRWTLTLRKKTKPDFWTRAALRSFQWRPSLTCLTSGLVNRCTPFQPLLLPNVPHEKQRQDFEFFIFKPHERRRRRRRNTLQQKSPLPFWMETKPELWMETKPEVKNLQEPVIKYHSHPYTMVEISQLSTCFCFCSLAFNQFFFPADEAPVVEVKGPAAGGKDVGAGEGFKQREEMSGGERHWEDCFLWLLRVLESPLIAWTSVRVSTSGETLL